MADPSRFLLFGQVSCYHKQQTALSCSLRGLLRALVTSSAFGSRRSLFGTFACARPSAVALHPGTGLSEVVSRRAGVEDLEGTRPSPEGAGPSLRHGAAPPLPPWRHLSRPREGSRVSAGASL